MAECPFSPTTSPDTQNTWGPTLQIMAIMAVERVQSSLAPTHRNRSTHGVRPVRNRSSDLVATLGGHLELQHERRGLVDRIPEQSEARGLPLSDARRRDERGARRSATVPMSTGDRVETRAAKGMQHAKCWFLMV